MQRPGPEIWLAGRAPVPVARAAQLGDGLIVVGGPDLYREYLDAHAATGRRDPARSCIFAFTYPSHDPAADNRRLGEHAAYRMANYAKWYGTAGDLPSDKTFLQGADSATLQMFGPPDQVVAELKAAEAAGATAALWFGTFPGARPSATLSLFETLSKEVMPAFR